MQTVQLILIIVNSFNSKEGVRRQVYIHGRLKKYRSERRTCIRPAVDLSEMQQLVNDIKNLNLLQTCLWFLSPLVCLIIC
jgi:hypothetical protein